MHSSSRRSGCDCSACNKYFFFDNDNSTDASGSNDRRSSPPGSHATDPSTTTPPNAANAANPDATGQVFATIIAATIDFAIATGRECHLWRNLIITYIISLIFVNFVSVLK